MDDTDSHTDSPGDSPDGLETRSLDGGGVFFPGKDIGPFRVVQLLGEGGFGVVYLAEQTSPVRRRVALKVIKPGMDTKAVIARFEAERQALAMMDFPGIAKVFEAGATEEGRPYFVMEYVKGESITEYCDRHTLDTRSRLELFVKVCDAIQHAHQKGVIHRDIKPGNILVTIDSRDQPQPKVIDFGIAKAMSQSLTEKTIYTEQGQLIGTPEYMSPEQAEMSAVDIDTRSDVYALGVILYELLSGQLPFDAKTLRKAGYAEIQRIIREEEPPKPSTKLLTTVGNARERIETARQTKISDLQATLRKELEWIPLKALRKERTERYGSAEDLGKDVRRYLSSEPLEAGPVSMGYRFRKMVRRNKGPFIAAALVVLTLIGGIIGTTIFAVRAGVQARIAEQRSEELQRVSDFQSEQIAGIDVATMGSSLRKRMLEEIGLLPEDVVGADFAGAAVGLLNEHVLADTQETINRQFADQPLVRAQLLLSHATSLKALGLFEVVLEAQGQALRLYEQELGDEDPRTIVARSNMGSLLVTLGRYEEADVFHQQVLDDSMRVHGDEKTRLLFFNKMGQLRNRQGRYEEALSYLEPCLEVRRQRLGDDAPQTLRAIESIGLLLSNQGRYEEAEAFWGESLRAKRRLLGDDHPETMEALGNMAVLLSDQGNFEDALAYGRESLEILRRVNGNEHPDTLVAVLNVASTCAELARFEEAQDLYEEGAAGLLAVFGEVHPKTLVALSGIATLLVKQDRSAEAIPFFQKIFESRRQLYGPEHPDTLAAMNNLAQVLSNLGRYEEAMRYFVEALAAKRQTIGNEHPSTIRSIGNLGQLLVDIGRYEESLPYLEEALARSRSHLPEDHPDTLISISNLGHACKEMGDLDRAEPLLMEAMDAIRRVFGDEHPNSLRAMNNWGSLLYQRGRFSEAMPVFIELVSISRKVHGDEASQTVIAINDVGVILEGQGKFQEAKPWYAEVLETNRRVNGKDHASTIIAAANMGNLLEQGGDLSGAVPFYLEALNAVRRTKGAGHPWGKKVMTQLAAIHGQLHEINPDGGHDEKAEEYQSVLEQLESGVDSEQP